MKRERSIILILIYQNIANIKVLVNATSNKIESGHQLPSFHGQISISPLKPRNGNNVSLSCPIKNLGEYKVVWNFIDKQTLLSIQNYVITDNNRIEIQKETNGNISNWNLIIKNVSLNDSGYYLCQINTYPPKRLLNFLNIFVPPEFDNKESFESDSILAVKEFENITLTCKATGNPKPRISWIKEDGKAIQLSSNLFNKMERNVVHSEILILSEVNRWATGDYFCIATNDISPSIRRRLSIKVFFSPTITIQSQLISAPIGQNITFDCITESHPLAEHVWINMFGSPINSNNFNKYIIDKYRANLFKIYYKLTIKNITIEDAGNYICISTNQLGETRSVLTLNVYESEKISSTAHPNFSETSGENVHKTTSIGNNNQITSNKKHELQTEKRNNTQRLHTIWRQVLGFLILLYINKISYLL